MYVVPNPQTVGDFVETLKAGAVKINRDYQRGGGIWPAAARSALIETIILKYPMPAIYLHQRYDMETRRPYREIVDGQQRTDAILAFAEGNLRLSRTLPTARLRGKTFSQLDDDDQFAFLTYSLPVFLFTDTTEAEVREAFRRINSHTSILTAEEKRHSRFQGPLKWFVVALTKEVQPLLLEWGVFNRTQLNRMRDAWLVSEILYALEHGIETTKAEHLDRLYADHDDDNIEMSFGDLTREEILGAMATLSEWEWLPSSPFTKPYHFVMLLLAVMHVKRAVPSLENVAPGGKGLRSLVEVEESMSELIRALDHAEDIQEYEDNDAPRDASDDGIRSPGAHTDTASDDQHDDLLDDQDLFEAPVLDPKLLAHVEFVLASASKTNTRDHKEKRFRAFCQAISR